jgi:hypothetical protein
MDASVSKSAALRTVSTAPIYLHSTVVAALVWYPIQRTVKAVAAVSSGAAAEI